MGQEEALFWKGYSSEIHNQADVYVAALIFCDIGHIGVLYLS